MVYKNQATHVLHLLAEKNRMSPISMQATSHRLTAARVTKCTYCRIRGHIITEHHINTGSPSHCGHQKPLQQLMMTSTIKHFH